MTNGDQAKTRPIKLLAVVVAGVVAVIGLAAVVIPEIVIATGRQLVSPSGLYAAALFRAGVGVVLIFAAKDSRAPVTLGSIGAVVLLSAVATPVFGVEAAQARLNWEASHVGFLRLEGAAFIFLGCLIVSVLRGGRPNDTPGMGNAQ